MNLSRKTYVVSIGIGAGVIFLIALVVIIKLSQDNTNKVLQENQKYETEQFGYEVMGTGGGQTTTEMITGILQQVSMLFGTELREEEIPVSYGGIAVLPEIYRNKIIEKMLTPVEHTYDYEIKSKRGNWKVYDVSKDDFKEFYKHNFTDINYKNGTRLLMVNDKDQNFIGISHDVFMENEAEFLTSVAKIYESSSYYKNYPLVEITTLQANDGFGLRTQFTFHSLYSVYKSIAKDGRAFYINKKWEIDYFSSSTYYDFINSKSVSKGSDAEKRKIQILNRIEK